MEFDLLSVKDEFKVLCMADAHIDSTMCERALLKRDLEEARDINAPVIDFGDFFDAMQGKYDRRSSKDELRPDLLGSEVPYLQAMVEDGVEFMRPYKDILTVRGIGNHEDAIRQNCEWDVGQEFVTRLRGEGAGNIYLGGYHGWVVFRVGVTSTQSRVKTLKYHHGWGGGGPVTHGVIQSARMSDWVGDADLVATGHTHHEWRISRMKETLNVHSRAGYLPRVSRQTHFRVPGYKNEFIQKGGSFANRKGQGPKPIGGAWLRFKQISGISREVGVKVEETSWG